MPSHYPITAYEAQSGRILRSENRPGNIHDGKAGVSFIAALIGQVRRTVGRVRKLEFPVDATFVRRDVLNSPIARAANTRSECRSTRGCT